MFLTFEGPEGAGKTTAIRAIAQILEGRGHQILVTREPGAGELGRQIREILLHGGAMPPQTELFLFLADRANHVQNIIKPALDDGKIVLCDRYADSTFVYQALVRGLDPEFVDRANVFATQGLTPQMTFLLDLDPKVGLARIESKDRMDREPIAFHEAVRQGFLDLTRRNPDRWHIIDASQDPDQIVREFFQWFDRT